MARHRFPRPWVHRRGRTTISGGHRPGGPCGASPRPPPTLLEHATEARGHRAALEWIRLLLRRGWRTHLERARWSGGPETGGGRTAAHAAAARSGHLKPAGMASAVAGPGHQGRQRRGQRKRAREPMLVSEMPLTTSFQPYLLAYTDGKGTE